jgi:hypothetical protein
LRPRYDTAIRHTSRLVSLIPSNELGQSPSRLSDLEVRAEFCSGIPHGSARTPDILLKRHCVPKRSRTFPCFFRRRRNFSSLSVMTTTSANRDLSIKWAFDFKSDRLLAIKSAILRTIPRNYHSMRLSTQIARIFSPRCLAKPGRAASSLGFRYYRLPVIISLGRVF